jgi:DNA polymerase III alpha subunit
VKKGGVTSFDDLVAYTSLYRPGPMGSALHIAYCKRKKGQEDYELHPLLEPILGNTYGVMCYQEQIMKLFNVIGGFPLPRCYQIVKAISKKKGEIFEKARGQFIDECQKRLDYTEEQAKEFFESIQKFSGYAFNKSHACAYTYVSSRLLYLKAHYPLEFFAAILSCEKDQDKVKEYKIEAEKFGVKINPVSLNKSQTRFAIVDDEIYLGFADIKGIGDDPAQRIVEGQPYVSFEDFLERFGTDASVLKPLISLRVFQDDDPIVLYEFIDYYRKNMKSRADRDKRFNNSQKKRLEDVLALIKVEESVDVPSIWFKQYKGLKKQDFIEQYNSLFLDGMAGDAFKVINSYLNAEDKQAEKVAADKPIRLADFEPTGRIESEMRTVLSHHVSIAQNKYYGFPWQYILTQSPDYKGKTFEEFDVAYEERDITGKAVEIQVIEKPKTIKGKKVTYHRVRVMDGNGRAETVTVWKDDFARFAEEFNFWFDIGEWGNLLRIRLKRPEGGYSGYTFESCPRELRWQKIPKEKKDDMRCTVLKWPESFTPVEENDVIEKIKEDFTILD